MGNDNFNAFIVIPARAGVILSIPLIMIRKHRCSRVSGSYSGGGTEDSFVDLLSPRERGKSHSELLCKVPCYVVPAGVDHETFPFRLV